MMHHIASESEETTKNPPRDSRETFGDDPRDSRAPPSDPSWVVGVLQVPGVLLTSSWGPWDPRGSPRGPPWVFLEFSWGPPGILGISWGASWDPSGVLGVLLGSSRGSPWVLVILLGSPESILGASWGSPGVLQVLLESILVSSLDACGPPGCS